MDVKRLPDRAKAEKQVRDGDLDAALVAPRQVVSDDKLPDELAQALQLGARQVASGEALRRQGSPRRRPAERWTPSLRTRTLAGDSQDSDQRKFIALAAALLLYGQLLTYGLWVATGVVEEKASRVVEILLATLSPRALMAGKIVGLGVLGAGQMLLVVVLGLALALATGSLEATGGDVAPVLLVLLWFPLGYALYASLYAAAGALVSRQEDLQSATTPLTVLIIASFFLSFSRAERPGRPGGHGSVARALLGSAGDARPDGPRGGVTGGGGGGRRAPGGRHHPPGARSARGSTREPFCGPASRSSCSRPSGLRAPDRSLALSGWSRPCP
ncbi:MAG: ABC transporter permease [Thermoleophilaceae bacterium]